MSNQPLHMSAKSWLFLMILSIIWASSFIANEITLTHYGPLTVVALRVFGGALALLPVLLILRHGFPLGWRLWGIFFIIGAFNNALPFSLIVWGQQYIDAGLASVLNATTPIMTVVAAHFMTSDEKISRRKVMGIMTGFAGIIILFNPEVISLDGMALWGQLALLAASLAYAFGIIILRRLTNMGITPVQGAFGQLLASAVVMVPVALMVEDFIHLPMPSTDVILAVIMLTIFCSAVAYLIYFNLAKEAGATNASLVTVTIPPFAILMGVFMLGETFGVNDLIGMILITLGLLVMNGYIRLPKKSTD